MFSSSTSVYNVLSQSHSNKAKKKKAKAKKRSNNDSDDDKTDKKRSKKRQVKATHRVDATHHVDVNLFRMGISGNEAARDLFSPHCIELIKKAVSCHEFEDPVSDVSLTHLNPIPITTYAAVYAKTDESKITKFGCTSNLRKRIDYDKEKNTILTDENYIIVIDFGNVGEVFYSQFESIYELVMTEMTKSKELSIFQHLFFRAIHLDEGWKLGAKKHIMLQMLEYGCQKKFKKSAPVEFLMYDNIMLNR